MNKHSTFHIQQIPCTTHTIHNLSYTQHNTTHTILNTSNSQDIPFKTYPIHNTFNTQQNLNTTHLIHNITIHNSTFTRHLRYSSIRKQTSYCVLQRCCSNPAQCIILYVTEYCFDMLPSHRHTAMGC